MFEFLLQVNFYFTIKPQFNSNISLKVYQYFYYICIDNIFIHTYYLNIK
jgi:hypothetical protein